MASRVTTRCLAVWVGWFSAAGQPVLAADFSGNAVLTTDYVFRGVSQSRGRPAVQASVRMDAGNGFYGAVWASTIDFRSAPDATAEVDYITGWQRKWGDHWHGDINATWFTYPSSSADLDYAEMIATATYRDRAWLVLGVSRDVFATGRTGVYANTGIRVPLNDRLRLEWAAGYYRLDAAYGRSYAHGQATAAWRIQPGLELRVSGHLTNRQARVLFGDVASSRIEAAVQVSF